MVRIDTPPSQLFQTERDGPSDRARPRHPAGVHEPLAARMRPRGLDQFVGQEHLLGSGQALREAVEGGRPLSMILHGPPGTGKTTLARILAATTDAAFEEMSAVEAGRREVREAIARARERLAAADRATILFLDEIHRFNKAQQDALLPAAEDGVVALVGATTENPYFEVNSALISRCRVFELRPLAQADVIVVLRRALDRADGVTRPIPPIADGVLEFLADRCGGDARMALNALELATDTARERSEAVTIPIAEGALQQRAIAYDKAGDHHYDYASAFIKALRGSDPDAALYYMAVMLEAGDDPRFLARRMVIFASEDIGNADPSALQMAVAAAGAVEHVGMPECALNLSQAATYLALAPRSNASTIAIGRALRDVREHGALLPPDELRATGYPGARMLGRGQGYENPHEAPDPTRVPSCMPDALAGRRYYEPRGLGDEAEFARRIEAIRARRSPRSPGRQST